MLRQNVVRQRGEGINTGWKKAEVKMKGGEGKGDTPY